MDLAWRLFSVLCQGAGLVADLALQARTHFVITFSMAVEIQYSAVLCMTSSWDSPKMP